jgi:hypothetical protein
MRRQRDFSGTNLECANALEILCLEGKLQLDILTVGCLDILDDLGCELVQCR